MSLVNKIALGTVQFGLDYGINNTSGKVSQSEVASILKYCRDVGIDTLDTAAAYGNSEEVLSAAGIDTLGIITKLPATEARNVMDSFEASLNRLGVQSLYAYMLHNFSIYKENPDCWNDLKMLKQRGKVKKIGISLNEVEELETLWEVGITPDIVQFPYNVFDRRFEKYFARLRKDKTEVHTRSTFLQGLFFAPIDSLSSHFDGVKDKLLAIDKTTLDLNIDKATLCLMFVLQNPNIDKVVVGVDTLSQLTHNVSCIENAGDEVGTLDQLKVDDIMIINPSNWKK